jgi:hypothetical protein
MTGEPRCSVDPVGYSWIVNVRLHPQYGGSYAPPIDGICKRKDSAVNVSHDPFAQAPLTPISPPCQQRMDLPFFAPKHSAARKCAAQLLFHLSARLVQFVYVQNFKESQCAPQSHGIWSGDIMGHSSPKHSFNFPVGAEGFEHSQPGKRRSYVVSERNDHGQMVVWCPDHHDQISRTS